MHWTIVPGLILILKGLTQLWKSRRRYPKYMPKCSVGSTDDVCNFFAKNYWVMWKILYRLKFPPKKFTWRHFRQWRKNFGFGSALFTQFWRCKYGFVFYSNVQRTFEDGKIKWTVFTRPHAMKRPKSISPMLRNTDLSFWMPVNFEVEYFLNEETEGVLTDTMILFLWPAPNLAITAHT